MKHLKELLLGLLASLATTLIVLGALSISITEGMVFVPTQPLKATPNPLDFDLTTLLPEQTRETTATGTNHIITATPPAFQSCNYPKKWKPYTVEVGDTLKELAKQFGVTQQELKDANCLLSDELVPGTDIYAPPLQPTATKKPTRTQEPTQTSTRVPTNKSVQCGIPTGWITYRIQAGENLFRIGLRYNITAEELRRVNCLASSDQIIAGAIIYVPNVPTIAPTYTRTSPPPTATQKPTKVPTSKEVFTATLPVSTSTAVPTTAVPTAVVPTTAVPATAAPTTAVPTTAVPPTTIPAGTSIATAASIETSGSPIPTENTLVP